MKKSSVLIMVLLMAAVAVAGKVEVIAEVQSSFVVKADLRTDAIRMPVDVSELQPLAQNSAPEWGAGGDPEISTFVRVVKMGAEDPDDISNWTVLSSSELDSVIGEGTTTWEPKMQLLYKLELVREGDVVETAHFNMMDTRGLEEGIPIQDAEITLPYKTIEYTGHDIEPVGLVVVLDGVQLIEGVNYLLTYENNRYVGTATITIVAGDGYKGDVRRTFEIVPASTLPQSDVVSSGGRLDGRTNSVLSVSGHGQLLPFTWNTSEPCTTYTPSVWTIGGLPSDANAEATIAIAQIDGPEDEPTDEDWQTLKVSTGEGTVKWTGVRNGWYKARLTVTLDGVAVEGALERVIRVRGCNGFVIQLQ